MKTLEQIKSILAPFIDKSVRVTKTASKRENSQISVGSVKAGDLSLFDYAATEDRQAEVGISIFRGFNWFKTSPVVDVVNITEDGATIETEGGTYSLEIFDGKITCKDCGTKMLPVRKLHCDVCANCRIVLD